MLFLCWLSPGQRALSCPRDSPCCSSCGFSAECVFWGADKHKPGACPYPGRNLPCQQPPFLFFQVSRRKHNCSSRSTVFIASWGAFINRVSPHMLSYVLLKQIFHLILPSYFSECPPSNKQGPSGEGPVALPGEGLGGGKAEWSVLGSEVPQLQQLCVMGCAHGQRHLRWEGEGFPWAEG